MRAELHALYALADALLAGFTCACSRGGVGQNPAAQCCHFAVTGREPYPTAVELEEVRHALRGVGLPQRAVGRLPMAGDLPCPLLSGDGRCRIYFSRPFGCRTFFCRDGDAAPGEQGKRPRKEIAAIGRRIADLSARFAPRDPGPRPLVRALQMSSTEAPAHTPRRQR